MQKTSICFGSNTQVVKDKIARKIGATVNGDFEIYLGLPTVIGKSKYNSLRGTKERVRIE